MFKKKINIILFILVLGVWGAILYNIASGYFYKNENQDYINTSNLNTNIRITKKDTFELVNPSRDPFLNIEYLEKKTVSITKANKTSNVVKEKILSANYKIPTISYYGYITTESNQSSVLLKIDNKKVKLVLNQEYEGVKLLKIHRDSIRISFNNQSKVIVKYK